MRRRWSAPTCVAVVVAVAVALAAQAPAPPAARPAGHGLLVGQVVDPGSGKPVAGALVTLGGTPSISPSNVVFSFGQAALPGGNRLALTDSQGHFVFSDLPKGTYTLQATKPGYTPGGYGKRRPAGAPQALTLADDERVGDLTIPLWKFATIGGTVTDEAGEAIIGIRVRAMRRIFDGGTPHFVTALAGMYADTDDRGAFRLATLIPGEYLVGITSTQATMPMAMVDASRPASLWGMAVGDLLFQPSGMRSPPNTPPGPTADGKLFVYPTEFYPATSISSQATLIPLRSGEDRVGVDLQLKPVATSRVSGTLTGPSGPMGNVDLSLAPAVGDLESAFDVATTITDTRGAFVFLGVPAGQYILHALKVPPRPAGPNRLTTVVQSGSGTLYTGSSASDEPFPAPGAPEGPTLWANAPVVVDRADVTSLSVSLRTGFRIGGRVVFDGTADKPAPDAIPRLALVFFDPVDGRAGVSSTVTRGTIDATGRLSSYELPPGKYYVHISTGPMPGWTFKSAMVNGRDVSDVPLDLTSDVTDVALTFTDRPSQLGGTVRTPKGAPDAGAEVLVFPANVVSPDFAGAPRRLLSARAATSGAYQVSALPPGEYFVVAVTDEAAADFPDLKLLRTLARLATRVTIGDGDVKTQDLTTAIVR